MKIGEIELKNNLILAPMAGFTTPSLRRLAAENGAGLTVTEMVSVKGLLFGNEKTEDLLKTSPVEFVKAVQLFGNDPQDFYNVANLDPLKNFDIIDINMGCPVKKIVSNNEGSALIRDKKRAVEIVFATTAAISETFSKAVQNGGQTQNLPIQSSAKNRLKAVTVKTRFFENLDGSVNVAKTVEFIQALTDAGVKMVALHARTPGQMYSGSADYSSFARVKREVSVPMAINGDITSFPAYEKALETGAEFIMIGRGAISNPAIFDFLLKGKAKKREDLVLKLMRYTSEDFGEEKAVKILRKFLPYILKGVNAKKDIRHSLNFIESFVQLYESVEQILSYLK